MALKKFTYPKTSVTASITEEATAADGAVGLPALLKVIAGWDGTNVQAIATDASGNLQVDVLATALPTGAATEAKQDSAITELQAIKTAVEIIDNAISGAEMQVDIVSSALPTGAATSANQSTANTALAAIQTAVEILDNAIAGTEMQVDVVSSALPTGASTSALQTTGNTALSAIQTAVEILDNAISGTEMQVDIVAPLPAGTNNIGDVDVLSLPAIPAGTNSIGSVSVNAASAGSSPGSSTVSTVATLTAPANTIGFILMNLDTSTANIRYRIGAIATSSSGQQLQPGRDTGYVPCAANISICAESGTQNYDVQWILQS